MRKFHVITGMLRAGSTLFCNILNQDDGVHASSTSALCQTVVSATTAMSTSDEVRSDLIRNKEETLEKIRRVQVGIIENWYGDLPEDTTVYDKSRGWAHHVLLLNRIMPESKIIVLVRDIKDVVTSIEKQHRASAELHPDIGAAHSLIERMNLQLGDTGIIGTAANAIMDIAYRNPENVIFVKYELMVRDPKTFMRWFYNKMDLEHHIHNFEDVQNVATDQDGLYWYKFPHTGMGKVLRINETEKYLPDFIQNDINTTFKAYNQKFDYMEGKRPEGV